MSNPQRVDILTLIYSDRVTHKIQIVCGVDRQQAALVLDLLQQPEAHRKSYGARLSNVLADFFARRLVSPHTQISVGKAGGLHSPLPWRVCEWLKYAMLSDEKVWLSLTQNKLREFIHGNSEISVIGSRIAS